MRMEINDKLLEKVVGGAHRDIEDKGKSIMEDEFHKEYHIDNNPGAGAHAKVTGLKDKGKVQPLIITD